MGCCNSPPCSRNRLFPRPDHLALGVLGVTDLVPVDLKKFDERDGWILKIRIDQQGVIEVIPLLMQPLLSHILIIDFLHGFLSSIEIPQESSSGGRGRVGSATNCAATGMRQTCGREMWRQKNGKYERHCLPCNVSALGDKKQNGSKINVLE